MPYTTALGAKVEFPYTLAAQAAKAKNEAAMEIVNAAHNIFRQLQNSDYRLITLMAENQRLKYENEFMLKLINMKEGS